MPEVHDALAAVVLHKRVVLVSTYCTRKRESHYVHGDLNLQCGSIVPIQSTRIRSRQIRCSYLAAFLAALGLVLISSAA